MTTYLLSVFKHGVYIYPPIDAHIRLKCHEHYGCYWGYYTAIFLFRFFYQYLP